MNMCRPSVWFVLVLIFYTTDSIAVEPRRVVDDYLTKAIAVVDQIYSSDLDEKARSKLIVDAGLNEYWAHSRKVTVQGKSSSAAFAMLLGIRPDSWELGEFKQAGDFGEITARLSRTKSFRSGQEITTSRNLVYEMVKVNDRWLIGSFRKIKKTDESLEAWQKNSDAALETAANGSGRESSPTKTVSALLDILSDLPPQALRQASEKTSHLWLDNRDARKGQGRVLAMVTTMSSYINGPVKWQFDERLQSDDSARVMAAIDTNTALAFNGIEFELKKIDGDWIIASARVSR